MKRRILLTLVAALLGGPLTVIGDDGVFLFRYANAQNPNDPRSVSMEFFKEELERRTAGLWGPLGLAVGVLAVPVLAGTVEPHPRGPDNLTYVERTFEPRLDGTDGPTRVLEQLDTLPEPKRRRGNAGRL